MKTIDLTTNNEISFIPTHYLDETENKVEWKSMNPNKTNWCLDIKWITAVKYIVKIAKDIVIVYWTKEAGTSDLYTIYKTLI